MSIVVPLYKLTRRDRSTYNGFVWPVGEWRTFSGEGELCGPGFSHWYTSPALALLLNPIHAHFPPPFLLWRGEGKVARTDHGLKVGCTRGRILSVIPHSLPTSDQCATFGIWCALAVYTTPDFVRWAENWLSGTDRTFEAAARAAEATWVAKTAAWAEAAEAAAKAAAEAAEAAAKAAEAAARAAAGAAAGAAAWAAAVNRPLDLDELAAAALAPWSYEVKDG